MHCQPCRTLTHLVNPLPSSLSTTQHPGSKESSSSKRLTYSYLLLAILLPLLLLLLLLVLLTAIRLDVQHRTQATSAALRVQEVASLTMI